MQNIKATKEHCKFCFQVLISRLKKEPLPPYPQALQDSSAPLFVTWKKQGNLRGCIGTFQQQKLSISLPSFAMRAAFQDSRFPPINTSQVEKLTVAVSLLVNFKNNQKIQDIVVGKHGIQLDIKQGRHTYRSTFLPEVAKEQGWNVKQTMEHLLDKAGYDGTLEQAIPHMEITTYQSSKESMSYVEFSQL